MAPPEGLDGSRALVTGASRGIGRALALGLAASGCDIVGAARSRPALEELGAEIEALGRRFLPLELDLAQAETLANHADIAWRGLGGLEVLVNAAGLIVRTDTLDVTPEDWDRVFSVNVRGTFFLTREVGRRMLASSHGGSVVTVASLAAEVATRAAVSYQASKAALVQMTRALAVQWAPAVRVNAVGPGYVRTDLNKAWLEEEENASYVLSRTPMARVGEPGDVVGAVIFLASPASAYVTGEHLLVDGGWSAQ